MFLHIGDDVILNKQDIIAIFDLESAANAPTTRDYLKKVAKDGSVVSICEKGKERSFIITSKNMFLSPISSYTLLKRSMSKTFCLDTD